MRTFIKHSKSPWPVVACIPTCQKDCDIWLGRLLTNLSKFSIGVAWVLDNLNSGTIACIADFPQTIGYTIHDGKELYTETFRNYPLQIAVESGADWWLRMDTDEVLEQNAWPLIEELMKERISWKFRWYNVWQDSYPFPMIRLDPPFQPSQNYRVALHPLKTHGWTFKYGAVASAYCDRPIEERISNVRILHYGFSTPELRRMHKNRWDILYPQNPYGMWDAAVDEDKKAWLYPWLPWLSHDEYDAELARLGPHIPTEIANKWQPPWAE